VSRPADYLTRSRATLLEERMAELERTLTERLEALQAELAEAREFNLEVLKAQADALVRVGLGLKRRT
jgi:hypothetical protein